MNLLKNDKLRPFWAAFCAVGWSLAYPLIKLGYGELNIVSSDLGSKILFAGIRFFFAGILVGIFGLLTKASFQIKQKSALGLLLLFALINTSCHYLFSYVGLSYLPSSRSTILDSMNGFMLIILSGIIFKEDKFSRRKLIGCIFGVSGILLLNIAPMEELLSGISFRGDGFILLNACCGAVGGILTRFLSRKMNMIAGSAYGMGIGGLVLIVIAMTFGIEQSWNLSPKGIVIIFALILISAVCFGIYNMLLAYHPISKVAIYLALIPILGVMFSALLIGEPFKIQYLLAGMAVAAGVYFVNSSK